MSTRPQHLQLVDEDGELHDLNECPNCHELDRELRRQRTIIANLRRDKDAEARSHSLWPEALVLFSEWRIATGHMRSGWTSERFFLCLPYLESDGFAMCRAAVWGVAAHPNRREVTPGYFEVYDDFELPFRTRGHFDRYANRGVAVVGKDYLGLADLEPVPDPPDPQLTLTEEPCPEPKPK